MEVRGILPVLIVIFSLMLITSEVFAQEPVFESIIPPIDIILTGDGDSEHIQILPHTQLPWIKPHVDCQEAIREALDCRALEDGTQAGFDAFEVCVDIERERVLNECPSFEELASVTYSTPLDEIVVVVDSITNQPIGVTDCTSVSLFPEESITVTCTFESWQADFVVSLIEGWEVFKDSEILQPEGGIAIDGTGNIFVVDQFITITKISPDGEILLKNWGEFGSEPGQFSFPQGLAVDADGNVYVVDTNNHRIQKFTNDGDFILQWGTQGSGDGQFDRPSGISVQSTNLLDLAVYVADTNNHRIQKFDLDGNFLGWMGKCTLGSNCDSLTESSQGFLCNDATCEGRGSGVGFGQFSFPSGLSFNIQERSLWIIHSNGNLITTFDTDIFLNTGIRNILTIEGDFNNPKDIAFLKGLAYITNSGNDQLLIETALGSHIFAPFGIEGENPGEFNGPNGIVIDERTGKIFVVDRFNSRIQQFDFEISNSPPIANDLEIGVPKNTLQEITLTGSDPDGDSLFFEIVTPPEKGELTKNTRVSGRTPTSQGYFYDPPLDFEGTTSFEFKANDGELDSNVATATITVANFFDVIPLAEEKNTLFEGKKPTIDSLPKETATLPVKVMLFPDVPEEDILLTTEVFGVGVNLEDLSNDCLDPACRNSLFELIFSDSNAESVTVSPNPEVTTDLKITYNPTAEFPFGSGEFLLGVKGVGQETGAAKTALFVVRIVGFDLYIGEGNNRDLDAVARVNLDGEPFISRTLNPFDIVIERFVEEKGDIGPENIEVTITDPPGLPQGIDLEFLNHPVDFNENAVCTAKQCSVNLAFDTETSEFSEAFEMLIQYDPSKNPTFGLYQFLINARGESSGFKQSAVFRVLVAENTPEGVNQRITDIFKAGGIKQMILDFPEIIKTGTTSVEFKDEGPSPPANFQILKSDGKPINFEISTTAEFKGPVKITITLRDNIPRSQFDQLQLRHFNDDTGQWEDITTSRIFTSNELRGVVDDFSLFAVLTLDDASTTEQIQLLIDDVDALVPDQLNSRTARALQWLLNAALSAENNDDTATAISKLESFNSRVNMFMNRGLIPVDVGAPLVNSAQAIIDGDPDRPIITG